MAAKEAESAGAAGYVVIEPLQHDGASYAPGDAIDLDEAVAQQLLLAGLIAPGLLADPAE